MWMKKKQKQKKLFFVRLLLTVFLYYLLLSTCAYKALPELEGATMEINYGFGKVRL